MLQLIFLFGLFHLISCQNGAPVFVSTTRGLLQGYHVDQGNDTTQIWYGQSDVFLGIPFAIPPIGELRFKVKLLSFKIANF
jgi:hypothetical protein